MVSRDFTKNRTKLLKDLKAAKELTPELEKQVFDLYGPRGKRALAAVKSDSIRKGVDHPNAIFTAAQVATIERMARNGFTAYQIAEMARKPRSEAAVRAILRRTY